jgi:sRNA-binding regulator protein Hfq
MKLDDIVLPACIKVKFIQKQYYKKYFFKVLLRIDTAPTRAGAPMLGKSYWMSPADRHKNSWEIRKRQNALSGDIKLLLENYDVKFRSEHTDIAVFFNDDEVLKILASNFTERIVELHRPLNEAHKVVIGQNRRIRVRKTLFENHFKFKVYLTNGWKVREKRYNDFKDWLENIEDADGTRWATNSTLSKMFDAKYSMRGMGYTVAIYLNDPEDLMMCQLKFNDKIQYIEEAVLLGDL